MRRKKILLVNSNSVLCTCRRLPRGVDPRTNQGDMLGEYKEMDGFLCPRVVKNLDIVLRSKIRGRGNSQV